LNSLQLTFYLRETISLMFLMFSRLTFTTSWSPLVENARTQMQQSWLVFLCTWMLAVLYHYGTIFMLEQLSFLLYAHWCSCPLPVTKLLEEMKAHGVKLKGETYICLLNALASTGQTDQV
jgi:hypothetical protein